MKLFFSMCVPILLTAPVFAQTATKPAATPAKPAPKPATQAATKPAPEMDRVNKTFGGRWTLMEKAEPFEMAPQGAEGKGTESFRPGPGGFSMISEYSSVGTMGQFTGHGVIQWVPAEGAYRFYWLDSASPNLSTLTGNWVGNNLIATGNEIVAGKQMFTRHTFSDIKPGSFTYTIESGPTSASMKRVVTITYSKPDLDEAWRRQLNPETPPNQ